MATLEDMSAFDFDPRNGHFHYNTRMSWPLQQHEPNPPPPPQHVGMPFKRSTSPLPLQNTSAQSFQQTANLQSAALMSAQWQMTSQGPGPSFALDTTSFSSQQPFDSYGLSFQASPTDYMPPHTSLEASMDANMASGLPMDPSYLAFSNNMNQVPFNWQELNDLMAFQATNGIPDMTQTQPPFQAPSPSEAYLSDTHLEVRSLTSSNSDNGWGIIEHVRPHYGTISHPEQTLHPRTFSDSSYSDVEQHSGNSWDGFVEVPNAISSPGTESAGEFDLFADRGQFRELERPSPPAVITTAVVPPIAIRQPSSSHRSPTSPVQRRQSRKNPSPKSTKTPSRRPSQVVKTEVEKRVGRRKGPLRPEQRKGAGEIRKLGACLRCKFLKKTCDTGDACAGCHASHARLWQVPCTRIDIKDLGYFMKDWKADYERHVSLGFSVGNIKGFSDQERTVWITHGFGEMLPVQAREVYVRDERCFGVDWVDSMDGVQHEHKVDTARLSAGMEGVPPAMLSDYLDRHLDTGFHRFVDEYFEGTPFITQILKTAHRYWLREKTPVIRKALKLVLAYNLTQQVTMVAGIPDEEGFAGKILDEDSKWKGETVAPVMINFQIKCAMADMWRELQKDILEELSALYSSVYGKDKLKHWPTIFMLASILLAVWEEMQFDCRYRVPDAAVVDKFCTDMETTPVGVIVGLFQAISQKLPAFSEWDTSKHHMALNSNPAVCDAMEEVRDHVNHYDTYLRSRNKATFDRTDFDSLSNKFVSKLVIRAN